MGLLQRIKSSAMILFATMLMPLAPSTSGDVLRRLAAFTQQAQSLSVECKLTSPAVNTPGTAKLLFVRPNDQRYTLNWQHIDYRFTGNERGSMDLEANSKRYESESDWNGLAVPRTEMALISGASLTFPFFLLDPSMKYMSDVSYAGQVKINGSQT